MSPGLRGSLETLTYKGADYVYIIYPHKIYSLLDLFSEDLFAREAGSCHFRLHFQNGVPMS
jgi:hypothetical protein